MRLARDGMAELTGILPLVDDDPRWFAQMASLPLPPCDTSALKAAPVRRVPHRDPGRPLGRHAVRCGVSVQGYNTRADIERLLDALARLLPEVATHSS